MSLFSRAVVPLFAALSASVAPACGALAQETAAKLIPFTPPPESAMPRGPLGSLCVLATAFQVTHRLGRDDVAVYVEGENRNVEC